MCSVKLGRPLTLLFTLITFVHFRWVWSAPFFDVAREVGSGAETIKETAQGVQTGLHGADAASAGRSATNGISGATHLGDAGETSLKAGEELLSGRSAANGQTAVHSSTISQIPGQTAPEFAQGASTPKSSVSVSISRARTFAQRFRKNTMASFGTFLQRDAKGTPLTSDGAKTSSLASDGAKGSHPTSDGVQTGSETSKEPKIPPPASEEPKTPPPASDDEPITIETADGIVRLGQDGQIVHAVSPQRIGEVAAELEAKILKVNPDASEAQLAMLRKLKGESNTPVDALSPSSTADTSEKARQDVEQLAVLLKSMLKKNNPRASLTEVGWLDQFLPKRNLNTYLGRVTNPLALERIVSGIASHVTESVANDAALIRETFNAQDLIGFWGRLSKQFQAPFRWIARQVKLWRSNYMIRWLAKTDHPIDYLRAFVNDQPFGKAAILAGEKRGIVGHLLFDWFRMVDRTREAYPLGAPGAKYAKLLGQKISKLLGFKPAKVHPSPQEITDVNGATRTGSTGLQDSTLAGSTGLQDSSQTRKGVENGEGINSGSTSSESKISADNPSKNPPKNPADNPSENPAETHSQNPADNPSKNPSTQTSVLPGSKTIPKNLDTSEKLPAIPRVWNFLTTPFQWISRHLMAWQQTRYLRTAAFYLSYLAKNAQLEARIEIAKDPFLLAVIAERRAQAAEGGLFRQRAGILKPKAEHPNQGLHGTKTSVPGNVEKPESPSAQGGAPAP
ncbi:hypothetical protein CROQUDRAFT_200100 [Cronartium quercuum f. sp. fusiforme G11]|uniref:Uncharacterized protein n=1 Tax=Cronartium quercuum f. sp. fusiforme G11 TaxID=708437 RepID=A0A9P6NFG0_9BASI|nr:hypothetical protein CROQUDRAFT_200100 [Cronartium quercuum f. sp. fusiforme G11]